jgi:hypothetical protein
MVYTLHRLLDCLRPNGHRRTWLCSGVCHADFNLFRHIHKNAKKKVTTSSITSAQLARAVTGDLTSRKHKQFWQSVQGQGQAKGFLKKSSVKKAGELFSLSRKHLRIMTGSLIGYCHLVHGPLWCPLFYILFHSILLYSTLFYGPRYHRTQKQLLQSQRSYHEKENLKTT